MVEWPVAYINHGQNLHIQFVSANKRNDTILSSKQSALTIHIFNMALQQINEYLPAHSRSPDMPIGTLQTSQGDSIVLLLYKLSREQPYSGKMLTQHCNESVAYPLVGHVRQTS